MYLCMHDSIQYTCMYVWVGGAEGETERKRENLGRCRVRGWSMRDDVDHVICVMTGKRLIIVSSCSLVHGRRPRGTGETVPPKFWLEGRSVHPSSPIF